MYASIRSRHAVAERGTGTQILKCVEGLHNKAFLLTMDNGMEVFAKLPNPNAGPARFTTASEVATRQLVSVGAIDMLCLADMQS